MKKKLTYPLLALVVVLWGIIFYRIFMGMRGDGPAVQLSAQMAPLIKTTPMRTNDTLLLDYRDPFLGISELYMEEPFEADFYMGEYADMEPEPYMDWSMVQYYGSITHAGGGKAVALVSINGREYMLKTGETIVGFTLLSRTNNSITVSYQGQTGMISMQQMQPINEQYENHEEDW